MKKMVVDIKITFLIGAAELLLSGFVWPYANLTSAVFVICGTGLIIFACTQYNEQKKRLEKYDSLGTVLWFDWAEEGLNGKDKKDSRIWKRFSRFTRR